MTPRKHFESTISPVSSTAALSDCSRSAVATIDAASDTLLGRDAGSTSIMVCAPLWIRVPVSVIWRPSSPRTRASAPCFPGATRSGHGSTFESTPSSRRPGYGRSTIVPLKLFGCPNSNVPHVERLPHRGCEVVQPEVVARSGHQEQDGERGQTEWLEWDLTDRRVPCVADEHADKRVERAG